MLCLAVICLSVVSALASAPYGESRCFDCNYAPSGYSYQKSGYHKGGNPGAPQCALRNYADRDALDQWACKSGTCFVRLDKNGLVYRGCADQYNLPEGVDSYRSCQYQAGSLWSFCHGDNCNNYRIGDRCSYKPKYSAPHKGESPCDGKCYGNPSGLFPNSYDSKSFIQCGCGRDGYGNTCTCCVPFHFKCPYGTKFNAYKRQCV